MNVFALFKDCIEKEKELNLKASYSYERKEQHLKVINIMDELRLLLIKFDEHDIKKFSFLIGVLAVMAMMDKKLFDEVYKLIYDMIYVPNEKNKKLH